MALELGPPHNWDHFNLSQWQSQWWGSSVCNSWRALCTCKSSMILSILVFVPLVHRDSVVCCYPEQWHARILLNECGVQNVVDDICRCSVTLAVFQNYRCNVGYWQYYMLCTIQCSLFNCLLCISMSCVGYSLEWLLIQTAVQSACKASNR